MRFFIPHASDSNQAEDVYIAIAKFNGAEVPSSKRRIFSIEFEHNSHDMVCTVGQKLPSYYQTGNQVVLAIFDVGSYYVVCSELRGGIRGEPILAGHPTVRSVVFFDDLDTIDL